ncbi:UNVERIFIED_CONTAM: hypothetical protein HDU68_012915 [Siphonaria sp. JEL0065]|nr:hypothetical protein HDU68_012915 [Siphonaria sp. JEL0065]
MTKVDILILGATGFTGKFVARDLYRLKRSNDPRVKDLTWAIGGRNVKKLEDSLRAAISRARLVINCVGPFRFTGVDVVSVCIELGCDYVDIAGEPEFVERILVLNAQAEASKVTVVPCCGFDCVPAEFGNMFVKQEFRKKNYTATSVEMFINVTYGPSGACGNYATYESAVQSLANAHILRNLRKAAARQPLRILGKKLPLYGNPRYEKLFTRSWCVPFFGADASIVRISQQLVQTKSALPATQFNVAYFAVGSVFQVMRLVFFGMSMYYLSGLSFGRKLLLDYPAFFSLGMFRKAGPSDKQIQESGFVSTFSAKGFKRLANVDSIDSFASPEYEIVAKVTGPEVGYVTTPITVICCALKIISERKKKTTKVPFGVLTPAAAFGETDLIQDLKNSGIEFKIDSEHDLI